MKRNRTPTLTLLVALTLVASIGLASTLAVAGPRGRMGSRGERPSPEMMLDRLAARLELTDEQRSTLEPILIAHREQAERAWDQGAELRRALHEQVTAAEFDEQLAERPGLLAVSKLDLPEVREALPGFRETMQGRGYSVLGFSAATREGVKELLDALEGLLGDHPSSIVRSQQTLPTAADRPHGPPDAHEPPDGAE